MLHTHDALLAAHVWLQTHCTHTYHIYFLYFIANFWVHVLKGGTGFEVRFGLVLHTHTIFFFLCCLFFLCIFLFLCLAFLLPLPSHSYLLLCSCACILPPTCVSVLPLQTTIHPALPSAHLKYSVHHIQSSHQCPSLFLNLHFMPYNLFHTTATTTSHQTSYLSTPCLHSLLPAYHTCPCPHHHILLSHLIPSLYSENSIISRMSSSTITYRAHSEGSVALHALSAPCTCLLSLMFWHCVLWAPTCTVLFATPTCWLHHPSWHLHGMHGKAWERAGLGALPVCAFSTYLHCLYYPFCVCSFLNAFPTPPFTCMRQKDRHLLSTHLHARQHFFSIDLPTLHPHRHGHSPLFFLVGRMEKMIGQITLGWTGRQAGKSSLSDRQTSPHPPLKKINSSISGIMHLLYAV